MLQFLNWMENKTSFFAGGLAGAMEHGLLYPIDTIKTRLQTGSKIRGHLFRGVSTMLIATVPAHSLYFTTYESCKKRNVHDVVSGGLAVIGHDLIMTPADTIKQRIQIGETLKSSLRFKLMFKSLPITLFMNIPFSGTVVVVNEYIKKRLNPTGEWNLPVYLFSGMTSGAVAAIVTNPLDVIKTRIQTRTECYSTQEKYWFLRGIQPRIFMSSSSVMVSWVSYEYFLTHL